MASLAHRADFTLGDYLRFEASSPTRHEFFDGQIFATAGGSPEHAALTAEVIAQLRIALRQSPCRVYSPDLRVRIPSSGLETYPDVTVICGPRVQDAKDELAVNNPTLIVEVLTPGTARYDRTDKFEHYKLLPSFRQYVLVAQSERQVEVRTLGDDAAWSSKTYGDGDHAELSAIGAVLDVRELYDSVVEPQV